LLLQGEGKGKGHPITFCEGREREREELKYICTLSLTLALDGVDVNATPNRFAPRYDLVPFV